MDSMLQPHAPAPAHYVPFDPDDRQSTIPARFEKQVSLYPERLAFDDDLSRSVTYAEFNAAANRIAHRILNRDGEQPGLPLGLLFGFSADGIISAMAALKAGRMSVALDPTYPDERNRFLLQDSQARLLLTDSQNYEMALRFADDVDAILNVDTIRTSVGDEANPTLTFAPETYSHLIYTSGSTGEPKAVIHSHHTVMHNHFYANATFRFDSRDRNVLVSSLSFGNSILQIYYSLLNGGAILPFDLRTRLLEDLPGWLVRQRATYATLVPSVFRKMRQFLSDEDHFPDLRVFGLGGEGYRPEDIDTLRRWFGGSTLKFSYGSSETLTIALGFAHVSAEIDLRAIPCGYPFGEHDVRLVTDMGEPVAEGQIGEFAVRGQAISPGYWRRPDLTAERFTIDADDPGLRTYWTGDLGERDGRGWYVHRGRIDHQVKVRGYRVETGEIESVLVKRPDIREAVVVPYQMSLAAYLVPAAGQVIMLETLREDLAKTLPVFMMPARFIIVDRLPQTASGKIDRARLPSPERARPDLDISYVAPRTATEQTIAGLWAAALDVDRVGVDDPFFDLGGHSLLATELVSRIAEAFGAAVSLETLFTASTVARMAALIDEQGVQPNSADQIQPVPRERYQTTRSELDDHDWIES